MNFKEKSYFRKDHKRLGCAAQLLWGLFSIFSLNACNFSSFPPKQTANSDSGTMAANGLNSNDTNNDMGVQSVDAGSSAHSESSAPIYNNPACPPEGINHDGAQTCAQCVSPNSEATFQICSLDKQTRCLQQETSDGQVCQRCISDEGTLLYDDCGLIQKQEHSYCETSVINENSQDLACLLCYNDKDWVIGKSCYPLGTQCRNIQLGNSSCAECRHNGELISRSCEFTNIDPVDCYLYQNEKGRCVDCYNDYGDLLQHNCSTASKEVSVCHQYTTVEDDSCEYCLDRDGSLLSSKCSKNERIPLYCEQLDFPDTLCTLCLDRYNQVNRIQCEPKNELTPTFSSQQCILLENDQNLQIARQQICLSCPLNNELEHFETRCLSIDESELDCKINNLDLDISNPDSNETDSQTGTQRCLQCTTNNTLIYQQCENEGSLLAPQCKQEYQDEHTLCTTCRNPNDQSILYNQCQTMQCSIQDSLSSDGLCESCYEVENSILLRESCDLGQCSMSSHPQIISKEGSIFSQMTTDSSGTPSPDTTEDLYLECNQCQDPDLLNHSICKSSLLCNGELPQIAPPENNNSPTDSLDAGSSGDSSVNDSGNISTDLNPNDSDEMSDDNVTVGRDGLIHFEMSACEDAVVLTFEHSICAQAWDLQVHPQNIEPMSKIFAWLLDNEIHPYEIQLVEQEQNRTECAQNPCACDRARSLTIFVPATEKENTLALGFSES